MYTYLLILKGENKLFATKEFETLWNSYFNEKIEVIQQQNTVYLFNSENLIQKDHVLLSRLTLTNYLGLSLVESDIFENLQKEITKELFEENKGKTFAVIQKNYSSKKYQNKEVALPIWNIQDEPKVDLKNPDVIYQYFFLDEGQEKAYLTIQLLENNKDYLTRMPKLRPIKRPYTLKSDMARTAINLLGLKEGDTLMDPFCGIGGILLEGYDMGLKVLGNDISKVDLDLLQENFKHYFPQGEVELTQNDCSKQFGEENSVDGIVTDIPYGRACRKLGLNLYEEFFKNAKRLLKPGSKMVIIYANFNSARDLALKYFEEEVEIEEYINKSMTRHILVLKNNK